MEDRQMVAAIVAAQTDGLAAAYDRYAPALHSYCRSLLGEPADADDAVQDTFIITAAKLGSLRDPDRLRPWLYAVARNECRRRLRSRARSAPLDEAGEVTDETVDLGADAERAELRALVHAALAGLNPRDREIIELNLRHDLAGRDLADALGVSVNQAHALASRARSQFETSLGALLVARTGRDACPELAAGLHGWDGQLDVLLRKRVNRHIEHCEICGARKRRELSPAMLLGVLPVALLPVSLRDQLFSLIGDSSPIPSAYRAGVVSRAGPFGRSGFPKPLDPPHLVHGPVAHAATAGAGAAVVAVAAAGIMYGLHGPHAPHPAGPAAAGPSATAGVTSPGPPGAAPRASAGAGSRARPGTVPLLAGATVAGSPGPVSPSSPSASPPLLSVTPSLGPVAGTLTASTTALTLQLGLTGSFTLTAQGGAVSGITIQNPDPLDLTISLGTGSLTAGQTTTVRVTMVDLLGSSTTLVVNPGGLTITVSR
jgi:RNA polymerase sigma factor (sigma-70 family)